MGDPQDGRGYGDGLASTFDNPYLGDGSGGVRHEKTSGIGFGQCPFWWGSGLAWRADG